MTLSADSDGPGDGSNFLAEFSVTQVDFTMTLLESDPKFLYSEKIDRKSLYSEKIDRKGPICVTGLAIVISGHGSERAEICANSCPCRVSGLWHYRYRTIGEGNLEKVPWGVPTTGPDLDSDVGVLTPRHPLSMCVARSRVGGSWTLGRQLPFW